MKIRHYVHLPNFLPSALPVCSMIIIGNLDNSPASALIIARLGTVMLGLLALTGLADIMANHYANKIKTNVQP